MQTDKAVLRRVGWSGRSLSAAAAHAQQTFAWSGFCTACSPSWTFKSDRQTDNHRQVDRWRQSDRLNRQSCFCSRVGRQISLQRMRNRLLHGLVFARITSLGPSAILVWMHSNQYQEWIIIFGTRVTLKNSHAFSLPQEAKVAGRWGLYAAFQTFAAILVFFARPQSSIIWFWKQIYLSLLLHLHCYNMKKKIRFTRKRRKSRHIVTLWQLWQIVTIFDIKMSNYWT